MSRQLFVLALLLWPAVAGGATFTLSEGQKKEALRTGERSITADSLDTEWRVKNTAGETALVMTPFHRLAIAARHATFSGKPMKPGEPERILKENGDRLILWVNLHGKAEDFARYYVPRLVVGDREVKASFVQNERTAIRREDGVYVARCIYGFPTRDVKGRESIDLVVADSDARDVSRFVIDLAGMR